MSTILTYAGTYKGAVLHDEIRTAFPAWTTEVGGEPLELWTTETKPGLLVLHVPAGANVAAVDAVVAAHDPNKLSFHEQRAISNAATEASLRVKLGRGNGLTLALDEIDLLLR